MSTEWKIYMLNEIGKIVTGKTPATSKPENYGSSIGFVTPGDFNGSKWIKNTIRKISELGAQSVANSRIAANTVVTTCIGSDMGKTALVGIDCVPNQQINALIPNTNEHLPEFVYYNLALRKEEIRQLASGSAQPILSKTAFGKIKICCPDKETQTAIVETIRPIDDRISLLQETNFTLEAIAQTLFKSWFIDFDPVRAKVEGRQPVGMDAKTAALFPDKFVETSAGHIPKGWQNVSFKDTVNVIGGGTPKTSVPEYWNGSIPWFSIVDAPAEGEIFTIYTQKKISSLGLQNSSTLLLPIGTTIISARGTVGRLAITGQEMAMNQSCYGLRGKDGDIFFTYFSTKRLISVLKQSAHGSVFDTITQSTFSKIFLTYPERNLIKAFELFVSPFLDRLLLNQKKIYSLMNMRDALLPRLMSGKIHLPDAEEKFKTKIEATV